MALAAGRVPLTEGNPPLKPHCAPPSALVKSPSVVAARIVFVGLKPMVCTVALGSPLALAPQLAAASVVLKNGVELLARGEPVVGKVVESVWPVRETLPAESSAKE